MVTTLKAPYPNTKVTSILPNPEFNDTRKSESTIIVKRTMTGRVITYVQPSARFTLTLPFLLTRMKSLEFEAFLTSYQSTAWFVELYDGSQWDAQVVGEPVTRKALARIGTDSTIGKELIELTLTLSATRIN